MKNVIFGVLLVLFSGTARAIDAVYTGYKNNDGSVIQSTLTLSSSTAAILYPRGNFCEFYISTQSVTYFFRIDGTTTNVTTFGFPVAQGTERNIKGVSGYPLALQSIVGASTQSLRYIMIEPK